MYRIGRVLHLSSSRNLIVKIENTPRIGETVVDENLTPVGKVFDIFGPVSSPYAAIKSTLREAEKLTDKILYVFPSKGEKRK
ncbi:MAG: Gar1/Naf1 family protein [Candidatus Bathyarchaeota archaeon]|nr:Gar1/Naf1 family protein [Candidatus Bathyarchaeota archaeon]MDI6805149.1 Gar1/Naf1 family protein [Candidatus Bathyarchaeia archaeon]